MRAPENDPHQAGFTLKPAVGDAERPPATGAPSILLIAYHFPPEGGSSGVLRTLGFCRYLPEFGWAPHVLTLRDSVYQSRDLSLLSAVPTSVKVHRTLGWDAARYLGYRGRYPSWAAVPDRYVSWLPFAILRGLSIIGRYEVRALFSTSPYPTAHLIAAILRARAKIPWIADFRDPWIEDGIYPPPRSLRFMIESRLERAVVEGASHITVTTPEFRQELLRRYPDLAAAKVSVIYNGYDEADFAELPQLVRPPLFEVLHAGLVTPAYRDPGPLLGALAALLRKGQISPSDVRVVFLGGGDWLNSRQFADTIEHFGLQAIVRVLPRLPHEAALRRLQQAAVLLVLQASEDTKNLIPAKLYEYLRIGRPILAITPKGATADLLRHLGVGLAADPACESAIESALLALYRQWQTGATPSRPRHLVRFSRRMLAAQLAAILRRLAS